MAEEAQARHYDSIIKIRSHLDGEYTPNPSDVECVLSNKTASVSLQSSLANRKSQQDLASH